MNGNISRVLKLGLAGVGLWLIGAATVATISATAVTIVLDPGDTVHLTCKSSMSIALVSRQDITLTCGGLLTPTPTPTPVPPSGTKVVAF